MTFLSEIVPKDYPDFSEHGETPCSQTDPEIFFPDDVPEGNRAQRVGYRYEREAKLICSECPYLTRCMTYALKNSDLMGIWGGTTEADRAAIKRGRKVLLRIPVRKHK